MNKKAKALRQHAAIVNVGESLRSVVAYVETSAIMYHLFESKGNIKEAASSLGLSREGLYKKCRRYGINIERYRK